uniref:Uncharacterized protein n=1 Tax=Quercus lobata TaxID=97700 RepID=A0A7N2MVJ4_QUELO
MGKRGKVINLKRFSRNRGVASDDMDDEIDAFHKQRDIIMRMVILSLISKSNVLGFPGMFKDSDVWLQITPGN